MLLISSALFLFPITSSLDIVSLQKLRILACGQLFCRVYRFWQNNHHPRKIHNKFTKIIVLLFSKMSVGK
jgi:hypothetical protein